MPSRKLPESLTEEDWLEVLDDIIPDNATYRYLPQTSNPQTKFGLRWEDPTFCTPVFMVYDRPQGMFECAFIDYWGTARSRESPTLEGLIPAYEEIRREHGEDIMLAQLRDGQSWILRADLELLMSSLRPEVRQDTLRFLPDLKVEEDDED